MRDFTVSLSVTLRAVLSLAGRVHSRCLLDRRKTPYGYRGGGSATTIGLAGVDVSESAKGLRAPLWSVGGGIGMIVRIVRQRTVLAVIAIPV